MFFCESCEIFKNIFFTEHLRVTASDIWMQVVVIVSATFSGVETLKYPLFHEILFFGEIFSFFNFVSDILSKWNSSKNRF